MNETRGLWRGRCVVNGEWVIGDLVRSITGSSCFVGRYTVVQSTLGECTGLRDKNKKLIFEGDILQFCNDDGDITNYEVIWFGNGWKVVMEDDTEISDKLDLFFCEHSVIIGNIHDNPELISERTN